MLDPKFCAFTDKYGLTPDVPVHFTSNLHAYWAQNTNLATKASHTAHPSTGFKAHTHSCHLPHLTSQALPWTYNVHNPNMSNLSPELRTFFRQFTDSQHVHTYSRYKNLQTHSLPNQTVLQIPKCPSQGEPFLYVSLRYNCRQLQWRHLCPAYQTHTQHPLLPHLVHLSERTVVHNTKTADLNTAYQRSPRSTDSHQLPTSNDLTPSDHHHP